MKNEIVSQGIKVPRCVLRFLVPRALFAFRCDMPRMPEDAGRDLTSFLSDHDKSKRRSLVDDKPVTLQEMNWAVRGLHERLDEIETHAWRAKSLTGITHAVAGGFRVVRDTIILATAWLSLLILGFELWK